jgi:hypothetical protein
MARRLFDDGGDAVGFLDAEFGGVADDGAAFGERGGHGDDRDFIDQIGHLGFEDGGAFEWCAVDLDVADRFATRIMDDVEHVRAHAAEDLENGGAGGVESDVLEQQARAGQGGGGDQPEGGAGYVAGHGEIAGSGICPP